MAIVRELNESNFFLGSGLALDFHLVGSFDGIEQHGSFRRLRIAMFCMTQWPPMTPGKYLTGGKKLISS